MFPQAASTTFYTAKPSVCLFHYVSIDLAALFVNTVMHREGLSVCVRLSACDVQAGMQTGHCICEQGR